MCGIATMLNLLSNLDALSWNTNIFTGVYGYIILVYLINWDISIGIIRIIILYQWGYFRSMYRDIWNVSGSLDTRYDYLDRLMVYFDILEYFHYSKMYIINV